MKKRCLLLALGLLLSLAAVGCSAGSGASSDQSALVESAAPEPASGEAFPGAGALTAPAGGRVYADGDAKLIRRASLTIQTTDFTAAAAALNGLVDAQEGYYESAEIRGGGYYDASASRYGVYTVRVPKERYDAFMGALGDVGYVVSREESSTDVGQEYADAEARLSTLKTKHERLLYLLEKAVTMEDIISLENALSDTEYEIDQYSSTLKRYDGLVDYATVSISLEEVLKIEEKAKETVSFGGRMAAAFTGGFTSFGNALGNFAVWCAYHFVGILVFLAVAGAVIVILRKERRRRAPAPISAASKPEEKK